MKPIDVIIAEIDTKECRSISQKLHLNKKINVAGEANRTNEFLWVINSVRADVVLMDFYILGINGVSIIKEILEEHPYVKIILLGEYIELNDLNDILFTGAKGFVVKNRCKNGKELYDAILTVSKGDFYFSKNIIRQTVLNEH